MKNSFPLSKQHIACSVHSVTAVSSLSAVSCCPGRVAVKAQKGRLEPGAPESLWSTQKWNRTIAGPALPYVFLSDNKNMKGGKYEIKF